MRQEFKVGLSPVVVAYFKLLKNLQTIFHNVDYLFRMPQTSK